jgi:ankyrin repeat protein
MKNKLFLPVLITGSFFLAGNMMAMEKETEETKSERKARKRQIKEIEPIIQNQPVQSVQNKKPKYNFPSKNPTEVKSLRQLGKECVLTYALNVIPQELGEELLHVPLTHGNTLLHVITHKKDLKRLIKEGKSPSLMNYNNQTVFNYYIEQGKLSLAHYLIDRTDLVFDVVTPDVFGTTPLMNVIIQGDFDLATKIIKIIKAEKNADNLKQQVNYKNEAGQTPLGLAVMNLPQLIELLIENGAKANYVNKKQENLAMIAAKYNESTIKLLKELGVDVNYRNNQETPLIVAAMYNISAIKPLIDANADPNLENLTGDFPLSIAAAERNLDATKLLIEHGANTNYASSVNGETALMAAAFVLDLNIIKHLVEHGAQINTKNNDNQTALTNVLNGLEGLQDFENDDDSHQIDIKKATEIIEYLLEKGSIIEENDIAIAKEFPTILNILQKTLNARKELALEKEPLETQKKRTNEEEEESN